MSDAGESLVESAADTLRVVTYGADDIFCCSSSSFCHCYRKGNHSICIAFAR